MIHTQRRIAFGLGTARRAARIVLIVLVGLGPGLVAGCASNPNRQADIVEREVSALPAPDEPFSSYARVELAALELDPAVQDDDRKVGVANDLEASLRARLEPVLADWNARARGTGTLVIQPRLVELRIVSGGARFWAGAMAGDSRIDVELGLVEPDGGRAIGRPHIRQTTGGMAGAWSMGATDRNLLMYVVEISHAYLERYYAAASTP